MAQAWPTTDAFTDSDPLYGGELKGYFRARPWNVDDEDWSDMSWAWNSSDAGNRVWGGGTGVDTYTFEDSAHLYDAWGSAACTNGTVGATNKAHSLFAYRNLISAETDVSATFRVAEYRSVARKGEDTSAAWLDATWGCCEDHRWGLQLNQRLR